MTIIFGSEEANKILEQDKHVPEIRTLDEMEVWKWFNNLNIEITHPFRPGESWTLGFMFNTLSRSHPEIKPPDEVINVLKLLINLPYLIHESEVYDDHFDLWKWYDEMTDEEQKELFQ